MNKIIIASLAISRISVFVFLMYHTVSFAKNIAWDALAYSNNSLSQQRMALSYLAKMPLANRAHILDIGCGDGKITACIAQQYPNALVIGVDNSKNMISFAQNRFDTIPNLSFECMDAANLMYTNEFEVIVSFFCLHWVSEQEKALQAIARAAKPGADILLLFSVEPNQPILRALRYANAAKPFCDYLGCYEFPVHPLDLEKSIAVLANSKCEIISCAVDAKVDIFNSVTDFYNFLHAMPLANKVDTNLFDNYIQMIVDRYLVYCPQQVDGTIVYKSPIAVLHAKKKTE